MTINGDDGRVVLRSAPGLQEWVSVGDDGSLRFNGQDLDVREVFGADEYEWCHTVPAEAVPALLAALGEPADAPALEAVARHVPLLSGVVLTEWFEQHEVVTTFWSRLG